MKCRATTIIAAVMLLLPVLYVGSYYALLEDISVWASPVGSLKTPMYRVPGLWVRDFYWPMEQIDRNLRPRTWG